MDQLTNNSAAAADRLPPRLSSSSPNHRVGSLVGLSALAITCLALFVFNPAEHGFYPKCHFYQVTGLQCPGCGGLRAIHQILHGHPLLALKLNALAVLALPFGAWWLVSEWFARRHGIDARPRFNGRWFWYGLAVLMIFSVVRNLPAFAFLSP